MDKKLREMQKKLLRVFGSVAGGFALAGGTALELYYLQHRFSRDLDFFSPDYDLTKIAAIVSRLAEAAGRPLKMENELSLPGRARVRFYSLPVAGSPAPLKIDFIQDVLFAKPKIFNLQGVPVYSAENIYFQKIIALTGTVQLLDETGKSMAAGRREARDVVDLYYLSQKILPLSRFLKKLDRRYQRAMVQWYRGYSRQEVKLGVLDLEIYDRKFDAAAMIAYLDGEIKKFMSGEVI